MQHLILHLEAPLMAFGGETIDNLGIIRWFPAMSMLTGLFANALGWRRVERQRHQELQDRIVFAARIDREPASGVRLTDFQSAAITNRDRIWTTRGVPEGRGGGTYSNWLRYRDYHADMRVTVALRLQPAETAPTLEELAAALQEPKRPLFIGRKPCFPAEPLYGDFAEGDTALAALLQTPLPPPPPNDGAVLPESLRALWPEGEGVDDVPSDREYPQLLTDQRNWRSGLHGGGRWVFEGRVDRNQFPAPRGAEALEEVANDHIIADGAR